MRKRGDTSSVIPSQMWQSIIQYAPDKSVRSVRYCTVPQSVLDPGPTPKEVRSTPYVEYVRSTVHTYPSHLMLVEGRWKAFPS
jgi:hypothetical protein